MSLSGNSTVFYLRAIEDATRYVREPTVVGPEKGVSSRSGSSALCYASLIGFVEQLRTCLMAVPASEKCWEAKKGRTVMKTLLNSPGLSISRHTTKSAAELGTDRLLSSARTSVNPASPFI